MYSGDPSSKILKIGFQRSREAVRGCPPCAARLFHHSKLFAGVSDMFWLLSACILLPGSLSWVDILLNFLQCIGKHAKISWKTLKFMYFHRVFMDLVNFHIVKYVFTTSISKFSSGHCPDSKSPGKCPKHGRQLPWRVRSDTGTLRRKPDSSRLA